MSTDLYFKPLKDRSVFLYDICNTAIKNLTEEKRKTLKYSFDFKRVDVYKNYCLKEPVLKTIHEEFEIRGGSILILENNTIYDFHVDGTRLVTINMLISSGMSHSIFKKDQINQLQYQFEELIFEEKTFYLYNVSKEHSVINFDKPRYMFTIKFEDDNLTYEEVYNWCEKNNLLENQNKISNYTQ